MRIQDEPWIDSIPPMVMLGESYFHVGKVTMAMEQYDNALKIALTYPNWLEQVAAPVELQPFESKLKGINWFTASRPTRASATPESGQLAVEVAGQGVGQQVNTRIDASEVLRTMGIAIVRRGEVLGPLAKHSPLAGPLKEMLGRDLAQRSEWAKSSWRLLRGFHALSVPSDVDALALIQAHAYINSDIDYYMTSLALLQLGKLHWKQQNIGAALPYWQDGSLIAARYEQHAMLAETLQTLAAACAAGNRIELLAGIQNAATWGVKHSAWVQASGFAGAAELATLTGDANAAEANSRQAAAAFRIRDVMLPRAQAQLFYANAIAAFNENRGLFGQQSLESALKIMRGTAQDGAMAKQIFQMQLVLNLMQGNALQIVDAEAVLGEILREPGIEQWQMDPLETIAAMTTSAVPAYATWLDLAERRGSKEQIVERMDLIQRQRLYEALPLGGRMFGLRTAFLGDQTQLPTDLQVSVMQWLQLAPELAKSTQRVAALLAPLADAPLPLEERQISAELRKNLTELGKATELHENLLHLQALRRRPLNRFVPFSASVATSQTALDNDDLLIGFISFGGKLYGTAITKNAVETWSTGELPQIEVHIKSLLSEIAVASPSKVTPSQATAKDAAWRETMQRLYAKLLPPNIQALVVGADRIIVVPDGVLWYLPFELLPATSRSLNSNWLAKHAVTYIPTLGSLPLINLPAPKVKRTLLASASFFSQDKTTNETLTEKLSTLLAGSQRIETTAKNHSPFAAWSPLMTEQLLVAAKVEPGQILLETNFLPIDATRATQLGAWIESPCRTPARLLIPGYQTSAGSNNLTDGRELFVPACMLLYNGTRMTLISRWPVGGRSTQVALSRFLQELNRESPAAAWQRTVAALWADEFLIADEPGLLPSGKETAALVSGLHPKLWSGYMVVGDSQLPPTPLP
jgi:CHAT domain